MDHIRGPVTGPVDVTEGLTATPVNIEAKKLKCIPADITSMTRALSAPLSPAAKAETNAGAGPGGAITVSPVAVTGMTLSSLNMVKYAEVKAINAVERPTRVGSFASKLANIADPSALDAADTTGEGVATFKVLGFGKRSEVSGEPAGIKNGPGIVNISASFA